MFSKQKEFDENDFLHLLEMFYCRYRFKLYNTDMEYMFSHYDVIMQSELSDYLICTTDAFHELKFIYTRAKYVVGREEYIQKIKEQYDKHIRLLQYTCRLISDVFDAKKKEDVEKYADRIKNSIYNSYTVEEIYSCLNNKYEMWKSELIHLWIYNNLPDALIGLSIIVAYMLYENNYGEVLKDFKKICFFMANKRNKHFELYDRILNMELVKFECMINKFYFYILVQYQDAPENDA